MDTIIEVTGLERKFGNLRAVAGMTFSVQAGEVFGLLGPNGAGKTTTVRLLNGILPPTAGQARVFGLDPAVSGEAVRKQTGVLTEGPALYERLTARENLTFFGTLAEIPEETLQQRVDEQLSFFDLAGRANDRVEAFSKGMKQRLALARALIHQPPLLFLDEPTSGLDPEAAQHVMQLIEDLSRRNGQTVILCSHNLTEAQHLCDRVAILNKGQILALGSLAELSRKLWPVTWLDIEFQKTPETRVLKGLEGLPGLLQMQASGTGLAVQVESEAAIPVIVRQLAEGGAAILRVNPRAYSLEDIYFTLQHKQQAGEA
jgi:ABC-2 type transport system ATP-binding protein